MEQVEKFGIQGGVLIKAESSEGREGSGREWVEVWRRQGRGGDRWRGWRCAVVIGWQAATLSRSVLCGSLVHV